MSKKFFVMVMLVLLVSCGNCVDMNNQTDIIEKRVQSEEMEEIVELPYLNQMPPEEEVLRFANNTITPEFEAQNCLTISKGGNFILYGLYNFKSKINEIYLVERAGGIWQLPNRFYPFEEDDVSMDAPFLSPDNKRLYFLALQPGVSEEEPIEHLFYINFEDENSKPILLDYFDEYKLHMQFSVSSDYSIFFKSKHPSGLGESDLYMSRYEDNNYQTPVNLSETINTKYNEMSPFIAPDKSYILFSRIKMPDTYGGADLFISHKKSDDTWSEAELIEKPINSYSHETCPIMSPDGKYLFFNSNRMGKFEIYWTQSEFLQDYLN